MNRFLLTLLAALSFSFGGSVTETHTFDSGALQKVTSGEIVVPGAGPAVQAVVFTADISREFTGQYVNGSGNTSVSVSFLPHAELGMAGGIFSSLDPYFNSALLTPLETWTYDSGVSTKHVSLTFTDPLIVSQFVGRKVTIPISFFSGYSLTASGGPGSSSVSSAYGWSGTLEYIY